MKIKDILPVLAGATVALLLGVIYTASVPSTLNVGGGLGTINQLNQWFFDGVNITQNTASTPIKITGLESQDCIGTSASGVLQSGTCTGGGGGSGTVTSVTSANSDLTITSTTTTPVITIVSAPKLTTPRNIAGVPFDGSANISLNNNAITNGAGYTTNTGTVTSVGMSVPTGLSISGSPITTSGTLVLTLTSGYNIPLSASTTNWNTAFNWGNHASAGYLTTVDISDNTNLAGDSEIVLTNDTLSIASSIARDSELHSAVTMSGTPDYITLSGQNIVRGTVDIGDDTNLAGGNALTLTGDTLNFDGGATPGGELGGTWASPTIDDSLAVTSWNLTTPTLTSFFGTPCTGNEFLQDISDTGAFSCAEAAGSGGGGGGSLSTTTDIIGNPTDTAELVSYVTGDVMFGGSASTSAEFQFDDDGAQFIISSSSANATSTLLSSNNAQAVRIGDDSGEMIEMFFGTAGDWIVSGISSVVDFVLNLNLHIASGKNILLGAVQWNSGDNIDGEVIANDTIDDDSIDFTDVTLTDLTFDVGSVDTTEFGYLNGVTSDIQTQLNAKQATITFGTGVLTALGVNIGSAGAPVLFNGAGGTPSAITLTNGTSLPISTGVSGLGSGIATFLATPSSANLASALTDEVGTGPAVFASSTVLTSPTLTGTPILPSTFTIGANSFIRSGAHNLTLTTSGATNVTLPTTGTLAALTSAMTGTFDGNDFGGGAIGQGDILYGSAAGTISELAKDTNATRYLSNTGSSNNPAWAQIALATGVSGVLPTANGGTGTSTPIAFKTTIASTSDAFISGGDVPVPDDGDAFTMSRISCRAVGGTSVAITIKDGSGNATESITCGTSITFDDGSITNASFTSNEAKYIDFGTVTGSVNYVTITVYK